MSETIKVESRGVRWHALQRRLAESFGAAPAKACATGSGSWLERAGAGFFHRYTNCRITVRKRSCSTGNIAA
jgi:hypothetical protein